MAWFKKAKKKSRKVALAPSKFSKKMGKKVRRYNKKHKIIGMSPDNYISPIDAVPPVVYYRKGKKAYKTSKRLVDTIKIGTKFSKFYQSRRKGSSSSLKNRRKRRGKYYYYRGKRYYRQ